MRAKISTTKHKGGNNNETKHFKSVNCKGSSIFVFLFAAGAVRKRMRSHYLVSLKVMLKHQEMLSLTTSLVKNVRQNLISASYSLR